MKISAHQLNDHLKKKLWPIYILSGDELLLIDEARTEIRLAAERAGFTERQYFETSKDFDWQQLNDASKNLSLFAAKSLIELKLTAKPGTQGGKALINFAENIPSDKLLLVTTPKLDQASQKTVWFQTVSQHAVFVQIWPLDFPQLLRWIQQRLQQAGLATTSEGVQLIAEFTEGNLLATAQEILKLQLLHPQQTITVEQIKAALSNHARFDIFTLIDTTLEGNKKKSLKILSSLRQEGIEPPLIIWVLSKELRCLINLHQLINSGSSFEDACKKFQIWEKRKPLFKIALKTHSLPDIHYMLTLASKIDGIIKGVHTGNIWNELQTLCLRLAGTRLLPLDLRPA